MRLAIFFCFASSISLIAVADESFPFTAFVSNDRTQARSGPSDDHYPTDRLNRGDQVEVYQRVHGGWLAIRPPKSSFSWVAERDVKVNEDRSVGHVISEHAISWIGTDFADIRDHKWQIKLDEDEPLAIVGKQRMKIMAEGKSDLFYKVTPPAGEFRWVHEDDIVRTRDELTAISDEQVELADFRIAIRGRPRAESASFKESVSKEKVSNEEPPKAPPLKESNEKSSAEKPCAESKDDFVGRGTGVPAPPAASTKDPPAKRRENEPQPLASDIKDVQVRLTEFDARLSLVVAQPVEKWDLAPLKADARDLADRASSTLERARVQLFLDKIASFESLKSKHALLTPTASPKTDKPKEKEAKEALAQQKSDGKEKLAPRFDGTGWLLPVHSTKRAAPPYALLDKEGNILQFVSPAPGLNLSRYLRKEVGIIGQREQASTLDKPHLTANRVVELERHRR